MQSRVTADAGEVLPFYGRGEFQRSPDSLHARVRSYVGWLNGTSNYMRI